MAVYGWLWLSDKRQKPTSRKMDPMQSADWVLGAGCWWVWVLGDAHAARCARARAVLAVRKRT
jgi:hypothetical protein